MKVLTDPEITKYNLKTMYKLKNFSVVTIMLIIITCFIYYSCKKDDDGTEVPTTTTQGVNSCEGCHTNYAHLQEVYSPDTTSTSGGCGGTVPHYEPYDRVYMGGDGYEDYKKSSHYAVGCTGCHNGTDNTDDKTVAHSGNFIAHPSMNYDSKCGSCHASITDGFSTSLHHGTGQMRKVAIRSGLSGPEDFSQLPQHQIKGYNKNCATCHGTCGNCHVVRPPVGGGGLVRGHDFKRTPDMVNTCVSCHVSRGGHAYLGVAAGTQPDVHFTKNGYTCINCHNKNELHGDGQPVEQRYAYSKLPKCNTCHSASKASNVYHSTHYNDFNCNVCHSQDYNNCGSCHIHGDGARIPAYQGFKIADNPLPNIFPDFKFTVVRRNPAAPDNWEVYGVPEYANFNAFPTYNYASPHNLLRWTSRTKVSIGQSCFSNCHIRNENGTLINKELYLFQEDLLDWEFDANVDIAVDGKLPNSWFQKK
ncbi:hypothetical protein ACFLRY_00725 [Bacteroidota bacterium]